MIRLLSQPSPGAAGDRLRDAMRQGDVSAKQMDSRLYLSPLSPLSTLTGCRHRSLPFGNKSEVGYTLESISCKELVDRDFPDTLSSLREVWERLFALTLLSKKKATDSLRRVNRLFPTLSGQPVIG